MPPVSRPTDTSQNAKNFDCHLAPLALTQRHTESDAPVIPTFSAWQHHSRQMTNSTDKVNLTDHRRPSNPSTNSHLMNVTISDMPLCSGWFSDIYRGEWNGCSVCLKVVRLTQPMISSGVVDRWRQLSHPNVLPFHGIHPIKNQISLVSPWMNNGNINEYLNHHQTSDRFQFVDDIAQGLNYLHENGIVHGDLKGKNVLVSEDGHAVLADFGSTSILGPDALARVSPPSPVSQEGAARWRAPETFNFEGDEEPPDTTASDVYAFAMVTYEIFANQLPFARLKSDVSIMRVVVEGERPLRPPASSDSWSVWGLTNNIWSVMEACWLARSEDRPIMQDVVGRLAPSAQLFDDEENPSH